MDGRIFEFDKKKALAVLAVIFFVTMFFLYFARYNKNDALIGGEPYHHLRFAEQIGLYGIPDYDYLITSHPKYEFNLIQVFLSFFNDKVLVMKIAPLMLGFASLVLFYFFLSRSGVSEKLNFFSCILLILSPPFIYTFSSYTNLAFIIFFNLLFAVLYQRKMLFLSFLSILPVIFISLPSILVTIAIAMYIHPFKKKDKTLFVLLGILLFSLLTYFLLYFPAFLPNKLFFASRNILSSTITDLGANIGFSIFSAVLAIIGLFVLWAKEEKRLSVYFVIVFCFVLSVFFPLVLVVLNFAVSYLASYALFEIYKKKWDIEALKGLTLLLIIYGILFSAFSFQVRLINASPTSDEITALSKLKNEQTGITLSHYSNGYIIEYFARKPAMLDERIGFVKGADQLLNDENGIFYSRDIAETRNLLFKNEISYIFVNAEMKEGLVWEKRDGLLFLLDHTKDFRLVYKSEDGGVEVWKFTSPST